MNKAETFPMRKTNLYNQNRKEKNTYYLAYRVPLHVLTQFDLSFAQEVVNSCVFLKEPI